MQSKIHLKPRASADLDSIWDHIAVNSVSAAERQLEAIRKILHLLADNPLAGRARPELGQDIRSFPVGGFIILHTATRSSVNITRVVHGRRKMSAKDLE